MVKNNGYFMTLWLYIWERLIKNSILYRVLTAIYSGISKLWNGSGIINVFRRRIFSEKTAESSLAGKIFFAPFYLLGSLQRKYNERITAQKEKSLIIRGCKYFLHNFLALKLRFIGAFVFSAAACDLLMSLFLSDRILSNVFVMAAGAALIPINYNLADILKGSQLSKIAERCLETELSYNFYYVTKCGKGARLSCAVVFGAICGITCGLTSVFDAVVLVAGVWIIFMTFYKVEFGVPITVFLAPIVSPTVLVGLCFVCLASLVIKALTTKKFEWRLDGIGLLIMAMLAVFLVSSVLSFTPVKGMQTWIIYFVFMIFYFVLINTIKTKKQFFDLLTVFVISVTYICVQGIVRTLSGLDFAGMRTGAISAEGIIAKISSVDSTGIRGEYILLALPVCLGLMWTRTKKLPRLIYALMALIMFFALTLTFSKGSWLGAGIGLCVFVTFAAGKLWGFLLIALPIAAFLIPKSFVAKLSDARGIMDSQVISRVNIWIGTILMLKDFWLLGIGPGANAFTQVYPLYARSAEAVDHSHNLFLQILVESGVVGLAIFILTLVFFLKRIVRGYQAEGKGGKMSVALTSIGAAVSGFLIHGLFHNSFYNYGALMLFWAIIAIGMCGVYVAEAEHSAAENKGV